MEDKITKPAIRKILRRAGVVRIKGTCYDELRDVFINEIDDFMKDVCTVVSYANRKTVMTRDVEAVLNIRGTFSGIGKNYFGKIKFDRAHNLKKKESQDEHARLRAGDVVLKEIKLQQEHSDSLIVPKSSFRSIVKKRIPHPVHFSDGVLEFIQFIIEDRMVRLACKSNELAAHCGRISLSPDDVKLALKIE